MVTSNLSGRTYGFVDCNTNTGQLSHFIESAQRRIPSEKSPADLIIHVKPGVHPEDYKDDRDLQNIALAARETGKITHTLEALSTENDNYKVGLALSEIVNGSAELYAHAHGHQEGITLYGQNGKTCARIVYELGGEYWDIE